MKYMVCKNCTDLFTRTLVKNGTMVISYEDEYGGERGRQVYRISTLEDGRKIKTAPVCITEYVVGDGEAEEYNGSRKYFWKPERRLIIDYDTEDFSSGMILKQDTIIDDWVDNEDGTYEVSLDGIQKHRILAKDVTKIY